MKYIEIFSILIKLATTMNPSCYKTEDAITLKKHIMSFNQNSIQIKQLKDCYAFVYYLPDSSVVVLAQSNTQENSNGFFFRDTDCFEKSYQLVIREIIYNNLLMNEKDNIFRIDEKINVFERELKNNLNEDFMSLNNDNLYTYYEKIKSIKDEKRKEKSIFLFSILFGEILRKETDSKWVIIKYPDEYDFYWMPALLTKSNKLIMFFDQTFNQMKSDSFSFNSFTNVLIPNLPKVPLEYYDVSEYVIK